MAQENDANASPRDLDEQDLISHKQLRDSLHSIQSALRRAPDRRCVTAPSGDRSLSYIHLRAFQEAKSKDAADVSETMEESHLSEEESDKDSLSAAVSEELSDWPRSSFRSIEEEVAALDPALSGTADQSKITSVFLKNKVPLKLPTFHLVLQMFCDKSQADQINYKNLFDFIRSAVFTEELSNTSKAEECDAPASDQNPSPSPLVPAAPVRTESWLQRFNRLERAVHLSDTQQTGYMEKGKAKRLIQNYNQIFDLNLSALAINEATCGLPHQNQLHLDTAFKQLKEL